MDLTRYDPNVNTSFHEYEEGDLVMVQDLIKVLDHILVSSDGDHLSVVMDVADLVGRLKGTIKTGPVKPRVDKTSLLYDTVQKVKDMIQDERT